MTLASGTKLGGYEILGSLGVGGMGEVYRARDQKLGREVAIKVLPQSVASDDERLQRFEREAKLLASLNHPGIATLHGLEESDGTPFLVMELVPGETLAERIARGPIPMEEALPLFRQTAEALVAAHDRDVIHRDLKPANVKITPANQIKILDFGLAKDLGGEVFSGRGELSNSPTLTRDVTGVGVVLGTASYMSPEQARGRDVDKRADVWAFGCVLYEALTGKLAFPGETLADILGNVMKLEPDWSRLPAETPASIRRLLRRCLTKDPERRLRDVADAGLEIEDALEDAAEERSVEVAPEPRWRKAIPWALAGVMAVVAGFAITLTNGDVSDPRVVRTSIVLPEYESPYHFSMEISPDGERLVYAATEEGVRNLYVRPLDEREATLIPGTENARTPSFSPDSEWLVFEAGSAVKKVRLDGIGAVTVFDTGQRSDNWDRGGTWVADGNIVFPMNRLTGLYKVSSDGGTAEELTTLVEPEMSHRFPEAIEDLETVLFTAWSGGNINDASIAVASTASGEHRVIGQGNGARYVASGHLLYGRNGTVFAAPFDLDTLEMTGNPVPVLVGVDLNIAGFHYFTVSETGTLAYRPAPRVDRRLVLVDLDGRVEALAAPPLPYDHVRFSPDGQQLLATTEGGPVHLFELEQERFSVLLSSIEDSEGRSWAPATPVAWAPDGARIALRGRAPGTGLAYEVFIVSISNPGVGEPLFESPTNEAVMDWSPDGTSLIFREQGLETSTMEMWEVSVDPRGEPRHIVTSSDARLSPDGMWLAYDSYQPGEPGRQILVKPLKGAGPGRQVSVEGGMGPIWAPDGRTVYYVYASALHAVPVTSEPSFTAGSPTMLFEGDYLEAAANWGYDISPDGDRFVMIQQLAEPTFSELHVVQNWFEELKRLVPIE